MRARVSRAAFAAFAVVALDACAPVAVVVLGAGKAGAEGRAHESPGTTALHRAAYEQDVTEVRRLLKSGAKVDVLNRKGDTPLAFALMQREPVPVNVEIVEFPRGANRLADIAQSRYPVRDDAPAPGR